MQDSCRHKQDYDIWLGGNRAFLQDVFDDLEWQGELSQRGHRIVVRSNAEYLMFSGYDCYSGRGREWQGRWQQMTVLDIIQDACHRSIEDLGLSMSFLFTSVQRTVAPPTEKHTIQVLCFSTSTPYAA